VQLFIHLLTEAEEECWRQPNRQTESPLFHQRQRRDANNNPLQVENKKKVYECAHEKWNIVKSNS